MSDHLSVRHCRQCGRIYVTHAGVTEGPAGRHYRPGRAPNDERLNEAWERDRLAGSGWARNGNGVMGRSYDREWQRATCAGEFHSVDRPDVLAAWKLGGDAAVMAMCSEEEGLDADMD